MPFVRLRSQLLPIGAPAGACPRRHLLTGRPWRLLEASCTLGLRSAPAPVRHFLGPSVDGPFLVDCAGGIRTHGLELMRLARTAAPLPRDHVGEPTVPHEPPPSGSCTGRPMRASRAAKPPSGLERLDARIWSAGFEPAISDARSRWGGLSPLRPVSSMSSPAGLEPATRGVEALCSSAELRGDRRPWSRTTLLRRIRAAPAQPARRRRLLSRREDSNLRPPPSQGGARSAELRREELPT